MKKGLSFERMNIKEGIFEAHLVTLNIPEWAKENIETVKDGIFIFRGTQRKSSLSQAERKNGELINTLQIETKKLCTYKEALNPTNWEKYELIVDSRYQVPKQYI